MAAWIMQSFCFCRMTLSWSAQQDSHAVLQKDVPNVLACTLPSGKALGWYMVSRRRLCFGSFLSSNVVVCGHCFVTLSLTINETLKWFIAAHPNAGVILAVTV